MPVQLVGGSPTSPDAGPGANAIVMTKYTAVLTGTMLQFYLKAANAANVCFAVYDDNAGSPNNLLVQDHTSYAASAGWNVYPFTGLQVTKATVYWLAGNSSANNTLYFQSVGTSLWKGLTFHDAFPNPAGGGWGGYNYFGGYQLWGVPPGGQVIWMMAKRMQDFMRDLKRGLLPPDVLQRKWRDCLRPI